MFNRNYDYSVDSTKSFMSKVYGWMAFGLAITALIAYTIASTPTIFKAIINSPLLFVIFIAQLGIVFFLQMRIEKMNYSTAAFSFILYSALTGATTSLIFALYTSESIALTFAIASGTFLAMSLYGYFTNTDLSSLGSYLIMGLFGLIIAMLVNMWFKSPVADYYISLIGVGIFTLLTAYDVYILKRFSQSNTMMGDARNKIAIIGALMLYLDFINLFLHLLRLFGKPKNN